MCSQIIPSQITRVMARALSFASLPWAGGAFATAFVHSPDRKYRTMQPQKPHGQCWCWYHTQPSAGTLSWTAAENKLSDLDDHLAALGSKAHHFKTQQEFWALPFALVLLRTVELCLGFAEEMGSEMGSYLFSKIIQHLDKNLFPFSPASASQVCLLVGGRQLKPTLVQ